MPRYNGQRRFRYGKHLYTSWVQMRSRCRNPNNDAYERYGGRGISVCEEWQDYETFAQWALKNGFRDGLTIERIDVNGNYCPENCTWITRGDQARNRRSNVKIEYNGQIKTAAEWSREIGLDKHGLLRRIRRGMSVEEAIEKPKKDFNNKGIAVFQTKNGCVVNKWKSIRDAANSIGTTHTTLSKVCRTGKQFCGYEWKICDDKCD